MISNATAGDNPAQLAIDIGLPCPGTRAALVIDRVAPNGAFGGVRIVPDLRLDELKAGARAMSRKLAFINVPLGGAKSAIEAAPELAGPERTRLLEAFGRAIGPLVRASTYLPACDMGTDESDLKTLLAAARLPLTGEQVDSSLATALTVVECVRQATQAAGVRLAGARVALEGLGKVGGHVARLVAGEGARLVAISTADGALHSEAGLDVERLLALRQTHGSRLVLHYDGPGTRQMPHRELFATPCDVLLPGVRSGVVDAPTAALVCAPVLVPFSNAGVQPEAERLLLERGALVFPDFVANCGGVLGVDLRSAGFGARELETIVATAFRDVVTLALDTARRRHIPICELCRAVASANAAALEEGTGTGPGGLAVAMAAGPAALGRRLAWRAHRRGRLPAAFRLHALRRLMEWRLDVTRRRIEAWSS